MIKITFPDGSVREYAKGTTAYQIAESISPRLAADSLAAAVNGATVDMTRPIEEDASVKFYKWDDEEGKHAFWHTSSHLLAEALEALYPGIKFGIGPAIENGFYYDVDSPTPITEADLPTIENKMVELSRNKEALLRREVPKAEALKTFTEKGYNNQSTLWDDTWNKGFYPGGNVFCYFGPAWFVDFSMGADNPDSIAANGGWAATEGPQGFFWGGTWICAATGTDNPEHVKDIILALTANKDNLLKISKDYSDFTNTKSGMQEAVHRCSRYHRAGGSGISR